MKYLRFGEIPKNGKSINFFKITNDQSDYFSDCIRMGYIDQAYENIPEDAYEPGLSVFDMDANGLPVLGALRRMISLCARLDDPAYIVNGNQIGEGNDREPLVVINSAKPVQIEKEKLISLILEEMKKGFKNTVYDPDADFSSNQILFFHTGQKTEYCFNGWTFTDPVNGFDIRTGRKGD